jgi:hypothetical protein
MATTASTTQSEARIAVDTFVHHYLTNTSDDVTPETIVSLQIGVSKDIQVRDYLMGLTLEYPLPNLIEAVTVMSEFIPEGNRAGIYSVLAAYNFQNENTDTARDYLSLALNEEYNYSLALLLQRVINSGMFTPEKFKSMTEELHPKVVEGLDDTIIE